MRKTVTISFSCKPETYQKLMDLKESIESERFDKITMSSIIEKLISLGFAYRMILRLENEKKNKIESKNDSKEIPFKEYGISGKIKKI